MLIMLIILLTKFYFSDLCSQKKHTGNNIAVSAVQYMSQNWCYTCKNSTYSDGNNKCSTCGTDY